MAKAILGRKLGMTQIFTEEGRVVPVTVVESGNNFVLQNKTDETDGYNAVVEQKPNFKAGVIHYAGGKDYVEMFFRNLDINVEDLQISIDGVAFAPCVAGAKLNTDTFVVKYANPQQGIIVIDVLDKTKADTLLSSKADKQVDVVFRYKKRGRAGVPTFMDWDGVVGSVRVLLTK